MLLEIVTSPPFNPGQQAFKKKVMGAYINPVNQSKEDWLRNNAKLAERTPRSIDEVPDYLPVCLVDNGAFTAAGIAFDDRELDAFTQPSDRRYKTWYWAEKEKLMDPNISDLHYYLKETS